MSGQQKVLSAICQGVNVFPSKCQSVKMLGWSRKELHQPGSLWYSNTGTGTFIHFYRGRRGGGPSKSVQKSHSHFDILRECLSHTMCYVSCVTSHLSLVPGQTICLVKTFSKRRRKKKEKKIILQKKLDKVVEQVGGGSVINGAYPVQFRLVTGNLQWQQKHFL